MNYRWLKAICAIGLIFFIFAFAHLLVYAQAAPMTKSDLVVRLKLAARGEIVQGDIAAEINERGIAFELTDLVIKELQRNGAKQIVLDALKRVAARKNAPVTEPPPDPSTDQSTATPLPPEPDNNSEEANARALAKLPPLEQARHFALNYTQELPNFIVHQRVQRFTRDPLSGRWRPRDTLDLEVTYEVSRGEQYQLRAINGQPTSSNYRDVGGASSAGEFGSILVALFAPKSKAQFKRGPNDKIDGRAALVFDFRVPTENSSNEITETRTNQTIVSGYRGSIWIDEETKRVLRIEQSADDIPAGFPITVAESAVDYSWVNISGKRFLLPKRAEVIIGSDREQLYSRNVIEFADYRKFETDIRLGDVEEDKDKDK